MALDDGWVDGWPFPDAVVKALLFFVSIRAPDSTTGERAVTTRQNLQVTTLRTLLVRLGGIRRICRRA